MASIHTTDIIGMKKYPDNYTRDLIVVLEALSFTPSKNVKVEEPVIYGSASVKMSSPSDYDSYIRIDATNISYIVNGMKEVIKKLMNLRGAYIADIKCGNIAELQVVPDDLTEDNYKDNLDFMNEKLNELYETKAIDKEEYTYSKSLLKPELNDFDISILKHEIRFNVARWTPEDILKGVISRRGYNLTLEEGCQQNALTKIDVISFSVNRYPEISMVYLFEIKHKTANISFIGNDREVLLQNTIPPLIYEDKFFKVCKRIFALERYREKPNLRVLEILMKLFNSDLGRLYQIVVDLNTAEYMFDNYNNLDMNRISYMLDQIRFRTSNFVNKKYDKVEYKLLALLGKFQDDPIKHLKELISFKDQLYDMMNTQTKEFLDINRLLPIPAEYLPYKIEPKEKEKRVAKNTSKFVRGSGEMTKYRKQDLLEDGDMIGAGGIEKFKKMNLKDLISEHKKLIGVLKKGTPRERIEEALKQYHELQGYLKSSKT
tara:strand:+ start:4198 stop:5661 length:1464 start_codon:yes stop_codon:yes gene_type:complete